MLFLSDLASHGLFDDVQGLPKGVFERSTLNEFAALPKTVHRAIRDNIQKILRENGLDSSQFPTGSLEHISQVTLHLPVQIGDFVGMSCALANPTPIVRAYVVLNMAVRFLLLFGPCPECGSDRYK